MHALETARRAPQTVRQDALPAHVDDRAVHQELLASRAALQSLNEELTGLVGQLQDTLELQRTTTEDLRNVLDSADLATVFLDLDLNIRLFTPATRSLFDIVAGDVGRPLADLRPLSADAALLLDAQTVLRTCVPLEREIEAESGACYNRRVLPYRTRDQAVGGVVITFADVTRRRRAADALEAAMSQARSADVAKSRFLASTSHDLRQPLQALSLMQGVLAKKIRDNRNDEALTLVARLGETATAMSVMLNTLTDLDQLEAGAIQAEPAHVPTDDPLAGLGAASPTVAHGIGAFSTVFIVDDDSGIRDAIGAALEAEGCNVEAFASCEAFLAAYQPGHQACILVDAYLPGMSGLELLHRLHDAGDPMPAIMITGSSDVPMAVEAMKAGALDFIEKPVGHRDLLASVERALELSHDSTKLFAWRETAARQVAALTSRQRQVMDLVLAGNPSKNIAADLGISQRTVENHRASIMEKTGSKSMPALARLALAAASAGARNTVEDGASTATVVRPPTRR